MLPCINVEFDSIEEVRKLVDAADNKKVAEFMRMYKEATASSDNLNASEIRMIKSVIYSEIYNVSN